MALGSASHSSPHSLGDDGVPDARSSAFAQAPGGVLALQIRREHGASQAWEQQKSRRWEHWLRFNEEGDGTGARYHPYIFSLRKFRLFSGWLAGGITKDKDLNTWRSAINDRFAVAELGRPALGFDVGRIIKEYKLFQLSQKAARGEECEEFRTYTNSRCVRALQRIGLRANGTRLCKVASLLWLSLYGNRAATLGGYLPGDATISRRHGTTFYMREVKMQPLLKRNPAVRHRSWPRSHSHPRSATMRVLHRCLRRYPQAIGLCARAVRHTHGARLTEGQLEGAAAKILTGWMREILDARAMGIPPGTYIASHSWRIMLVSACESVPAISRDAVRRETLHRTEASMLPYVRPMPYDRFLAAYFDDLATA